jgi:hypothetical protein
MFYFLMCNYPIVAFEMLQPIHGSINQGFLEIGGDTKLLQDY